MCKVCSCTGAPTAVNSRAYRGGPPLVIHALFLKVREMIHTDTDTLYFAILLSTDTDSLYFNLHFIFTFLGAPSMIHRFLGPTLMTSILFGHFTTHRLLGGPFHDPQHFGAPFMIRNISGPLS